MASDIVTFHRQTLKHIGELMIEAGFEKLDPKGFVLRISPDIVGVVSLTVITASRQEGMHVDPFLGVRHERLERLVSELTELKFSPYANVTVHTALGYITPEAEYLSFPFDKDSAEEVSREMVEMIVHYGIPWMKSFDSLEKMMLKIPEDSDMGRTRVPIHYFLKREFGSAKSAIERQLSIMADLGGPIEVQYKVFAKKFLAWLPK